MNNDAVDQDQADYELLLYNISDDALEAAAGTDRPCWSKGQTDWPAHNILCC